MRRILALAAVVATASTAQAQAPVTPGWGAFAGCWVPVPADDRAPSSTDPRVCVVPATGNAAELVSIVGDKVTERTMIDADGQHHDVSKQGCNGWESAAFSSDGRRLYLTSEQSCLGGTKRSTSGMFAVAANGDWINAMNVAADSANSLRVARYTTATLSSAIPADIRAVLEPREVADRTAHIAASRYAVSTAAVIEASKFVATPTVQAWLSEQEYDFDLNAKELVRLADAGVPPSVIDVMVAMSNPAVFDVRATGSGYAATESDSARARRQQRYTDCSTPVMDPWGYYAYDPCDPYHRYSYYGTRYGRYGYDPYYRYGAYDPYNYGYYNGYYDRPIIVVVRGSDNDPERRHGKMTKDGYKTTTPATGSTTSTTSTRRANNPARDPDAGSGRRASTSGSTGSSSTGSSSTGSSSTGSSSSGSGSSGSGRTATRKPPTA